LHVRKNNELIPISRELKSSIQSEFGLKEIWINGAIGFKASELVEVRILTRNNALVAEYVYQTGNDGAICNLNLDHTQAMGIDPGSARNWLTIVTTQGKSFINDLTHSNLSGVIGNFLMRLPVA
jgi:putative transposase